MPDLLNVDSVVKRFEGLVALDGVSLRLEKARLYGLIGPNGSGKTTLMNVVCGLFRPNEGRIIFNDVNITNKPAHVIARMGIARTFQTPREFSNLTVKENVQCVFQQRSTCSVQESLSLTRLTDRGDMMAKDLAYGQKKQLEFARALAIGGDLMMLDEPMSGLDFGQVRDLKETILDVHRKFGKTFLIIEHRLDELVNFVDWIFVLKDGLKIAEGEPESIINNATVHAAYFGDK